MTPIAQTSLQLSVSEYPNLRGSVAYTGFPWPLFLKISGAM